MVNKEDKSAKENVKAESKSGSGSNKVNSRIYAQYQNILRDIGSSLYATDPAFKEATDEKLKILCEGTGIDPSKPVTEEVDLEMIAKNTAELKDLQNEEGKKAEGTDTKVEKNKTEEKKAVKDEDVKPVSVKDEKKNKVTEEKK